MTILDSISDPQLFGPFFGQEGSWASWRVLLRRASGCR